MQSTRPGRAGRVALVPLVLACHLAAVRALAPAWPRAEPGGPPPAAVRPECLWRVSPSTRRPRRRAQRASSPASHPRPVLRPVRFAVVRRLCPRRDPCSRLRSCMHDEICAACACAAAAARARGCALGLRGGGVVLRRGGCGSLCGLTRSLQECTVRPRAGRACTACRARAGSHDCRGPPATAGGTRPTLLRGPAVGW